MNEPRRNNQARDFEHQAASEACVLLNEAIRELLAPQHISSLFQRLEEGGKVSERYAAAINHMAVMSAVIYLYRLKETRDNFLVKWLFSDDELRKIGFPPIEEFVGDWGGFMTIRGQYAGHVFSRKATDKGPGRILRASVLGKVLRRTGLWNSESFLSRVREELVPGVQRVRDELFQRFPNAKRFVEVTYPKELEAAAQKGEE